ATGENGTRTLEVPVKLTVFGETLPRKRNFGFTSWFSPGDLAKQYGVRVWSEDFWELLPAYAQNLVEHRQTTILTPMNLIQVARQPSGDLSFDFDRFDRWARIFFDAGILTIEGKEMGHRVGPWTSPEMSFHQVPIYQPEPTIRRRLRPLANKLVLRAFFKALENHLERRGWIDRFVMHVSDEPTRYNVESWRGMSRFLHANAPRIRRIEANQTTDLDGDVEISVPQLDCLDRSLDKYLMKRRKYGNELWFYSCMYPNGTYANRLIDYPLIKTRMLPWIAARYGLTGYLHWGYNYWSDKPFENVERSGLPPGDSFVVYPGNRRPLNSLRWEMFREGIEDYECLRMLQQQISRYHQSRARTPGLESLALSPMMLWKGGGNVRVIASQIVQTPARYDLTIEHFNQLHREIRETIALLSKQ
ncbi:MAG: DUF4091 domain-containing protein, partial [Armatimonadetes bacterium]|nr:DUF4091 domain-containing protein [Armatimonadota bacterium]